MKKTGISFLTGQVTPEMQQAYGGVTVFPTLFFVNRQGRVVRQLVSFHDEAVLDLAIREILKP